MAELEPDFTEDWEHKLNTALSKHPDELTKEDKAIIIARIGYLSDEERVVFKDHITRNDLSPKELARYSSLGLLDRYFPI